LGGLNGYRQRRAPICFDLSTISTDVCCSSSSFFKTACCRACGYVGERPESVVNLWAAQTMRSTLRRLLGAVHGLSTRLCSGRSAGMRTRPHIHRPTAAWMQTPWLRAPGGRLRRWIRLIYVDWVPPDFTASRSWPFSKSRDRRSECPCRDSPVRHRYSPNKGSPHRPRMP
jgi:hypothetical protein